MIKICGMKICPDCMAVEEQVKGDSRYQVIDIGEHVRHLKAFLQLRDNSPAFAEAKRMGYAGIPCFVLEDGTVTPQPRGGRHPSRRHGCPLMPARRLGLLSARLLQGLPEAQCRATQTRRGRN